jgi:hypothetical protein
MPCFQARSTRQARPFLLSKHYLLLSVNQVLFRVYPVGACETSAGLRDEVACFWSVGSRHVSAFQVILRISLLTAQQ